jgi:hypothetical protein
MERGRHETCAPASMALRVTLTMLHNPRSHPLPSMLHQTYDKTSPENSPPRHQPHEAPLLNPTTATTYTQSSTKNGSGKARTTPAHHQEGITTHDALLPTTAATRRYRHPGRKHPHFEEASALLLHTTPPWCKGSKLRMQQLTVARGDA